MTVSCKQLMNVSSTVEYPCVRWLPSQHPFPAGTPLFACHVDAVAVYSTPLSAGH